MAYLVAVKLTLTWVNFPDSMFPHPSQKATFEWSFICILAISGIIGLVLALWTGFPEMWDRHVSTKQRFIIPVLLGVAFGLIEIQADRMTGECRLVVEKLHLQRFHMEFPASLLVYPGGAIIVDVLFRLIPIPLVMAAVYLVAWPFLGKWATRENHPAFQEKVFWAVAILLSWFEPLTQSGVLAPLFGKPFRFKGHGDLVAYWLVEGYAFNLLQAYLFRRFGFLACLTMRITMYLVWHVAWGYATQDASASMLV
jgi:hypothetical protein